MAAHVHWAERTPRAEALFAEHAATEAYLGRIHEARSWLQRGVSAAVRNDFNGNAAVWTGLHAVREALLGNNEEAREQARAAVKLEESWETRVLAAVALARVGDLDDALQFASTLSAERPRGTLIQNYWLPVIRAQGNLHGDNALAAIESLRAAEPYELSDTRLPLLPAFIRGEAYLRARDGRRAAAEFQKFLEHHGAVGNSVLGAWRALVWPARWRSPGTQTPRRCSTSRFSNCGATLILRFPCCVRPEQSIERSDLSNCDSA